MADDTTRDTSDAYAALREKYRIEREKRLRPEGIGQYKELAGTYEQFDHDPFVEPGFTRDAVTEDVEVVIVGAGFGGMLAAINLAKQGVTDIRIIDKAGDFGGTWYWNRYPGCACDVESYIYLPLLEETGYMPTEKYVKAPEIFAYCQQLGRTYDLYPSALFQTEVNAMEWDEAGHRWTVHTDRGDTLRARFIVIAGGVLNKPKLPGIEGIETFAGKHFHTSRWDYGYTGGSPYDLMENLADKTVGIIGTGATAVQVVPKLAASCKDLYVFQRTPAVVGVRDNKPTDPEWWATLQPGWQWERIRNFTDAVNGEQPEVDMIDDAWTRMMRVDTKKNPATPEEAAELERIDFENMEAIRQRISDTVEDQATAELLKPWYGQSCKRPCFHDEYLPTFNRPNVHLVDTDGQGVRLITERGPVVNGTEYPVDVLVYASGYEVTTGYSHRLGFDPVGRGGVPLSEAWKDGPSTLHGVIARGFPNMMMISTVQGGQATNFVHTITGTARHVAAFIGRLEREGITAVEPTVEAQEAWQMVLWGQIEGIARYNAVCTPGYLNNEAAAGSMRDGKAMPYMGNGQRYIDMIDEWRETDLLGLEVERAS